jgi:hypothetical protein
VCVTYGLSGQVRVGIHVVSVQSVSEYTCGGSVCVSVLRERDNGVLVYR